MPMIQTVAVALGGAALLELLRVPAGALIGALVAVAILNVTSHAGAVALPGGAQFLAFAALGWAIGQGVTPETLRALGQSAVPLLVTVGALVAFGGVLAVVMTRLGLMDGTTAFLAASPGALSQMSALGAALGANAALVAAVHTVRVVTLILLAPLVARLVPGGG